MANVHSWNGSYKMMKMKGKRKGWKYSGSSFSLEDKTNSAWIQFHITDDQEDKNDMKKR